MLAQVTISGYKSLQGSTAKFTPFTVIVGRNNTGKSNLFDALRLLSHLAEMPVAGAFKPERHRGDPTFARFADMFHHRMLSLFYRAWAQAQPTVDLERPAQARFPRWLGAIDGIAAGSLAGSDSADAPAKARQAGLLAPDRFTDYQRMPYDDEAYDEDGEPEEDAPEDNTPAEDESAESL